MPEGSIQRRGLLTGRRRFFFLLLLLMAFLFLGPLLGGDEKGLSLLDALFTAVLIMGAYSASDKRAFVPVILAILLPAVALIWLDRFSEARSLSVARHLLSLVFFLFIAGTILRHVLREERVDFDKICAALCSYLLIGLVFAVLYSLLEILDPGAFSATGAGVAGQGAPEALRDPELGQAVYFSFTTLTTLGYGDITGASQAARSLSVLEALLGQIYLVVLVARLVGLEISHGGEEASG